jgi:hypothetical protein
VSFVSDMGGSKSSEALEKKPFVVAEEFVSATCI